MASQSLPAQAPDTGGVVRPDSVIHLLVVDDDMLLRSMAVKALRHSGFTVSDASQTKSNETVSERVSE